MSRKSNRVSHLALNRQGGNWEESRSYSGGKWEELGIRALSKTAITAEQIENYHDCEAIITVEWIKKDNHCVAAAIEKRLRSSEAGIQQERGFRKS